MANIRKWWSSPRSIFTFCKWMEGADYQHESRDWLHTSAFVNGQPLCFEHSLLALWPRFFCHKRRLLIEADVICSTAVLPVTHCTKSTCHQPHRRIVSLSAGSGTFIISQPRLTLERSLFFWCHVKICADRTTLRTCLWQLNVCTWQRNKMSRWKHPQSLTFRL